jgi:hypothetical protein
VIIPPPVITCPTNGTTMTYSTSYGGDGSSGPWVSGYDAYVTFGITPRLIHFSCSMPAGMDCVVTGLPPGSTWVRIAVGAGTATFRVTFGPSGPFEDVTISW